MRSRKAVGGLALIVVGVALHAPSLPGFAAEPGSADPPKVEYVEVEGDECLQPVVRADDATLDDYRAAQQRWIDRVYPGSRASLRTTKMSVVMGDAPDTRSDLDKIKQDALHLETADGRTVAVCFAIGSARGKKPPAAPPKVG